MYQLHKNINNKHSVTNMQSSVFLVLKIKRQRPFCFRGVFNRAPRLKLFSRCYAKFGDFVCSVTEISLSNLASTSNIKSSCRNLHIHTHTQKKTTAQFTLDSIKH